jgi:acetyl esterase
MTEIELHPVISELLHTKFNEDHRVCFNIPAYRSFYNDFIRLVAYSEADAVSIQDIQLKPIDLQVPEFRIRIYQSEAFNLKPVLIYFHGGNWIAGSLETSDALCSKISLESNYTVISVDYALAPEYHYPIPLYQGFEVINWIKREGLSYGIDPEKIVVGGDNAGGNIAAGLVHLMYKARKVKLFGQLLVCAPLQYLFDSPSYRQFGKGFLLSKELMRTSWKNYLGNSGDGLGEFSSPLLAGRLSHVPPTLIITAACDPLKSEASLYASRLRREDVPVDLCCFKGVTSNFWLMNLILETAQEAHKKAIEFLNELNNETGDNLLELKTSSENKHSGCL